jgi:hypothetical protein
MEELDVFEFGVLGEVVLVLGVRGAVGTVDVVIMGGHFICGGYVTALPAAIPVAGLHAVKAEAFDFEIPVAVWHLVAAAFLGVGAVVAAAETDIAAIGTDSVVVGGVADFVFGVGIAAASAFDFGVGVPAFEFDVGRVGVVVGEDGLHVSNEVGELERVAGVFDEFGGSTGTEDAVGVYVGVAVGVVMERGALAAIDVVVQPCGGAVFCGFGGERNVEVEGAEFDLIVVLVVQGDGGKGNDDLAGAEGAAGIGGHEFAERAECVAGEQLIVERRRLGFESVGLETSRVDRRLEVGAIPAETPQVVEKIVDPNLQINQIDPADRKSRGHNSVNAIGEDVDVIAVCPKIRQVFMKAGGTEGCEEGDEALAGGNHLAKGKLIELDEPGTAEERKRLNQAITILAGLADQIATLETEAAA